MRREPFPWDALWLVVAVIFGLALLLMFYGPGAALVGGGGVIAGYYLGHPWAAHE